jgi:hypothetical protein
MGGFRWRLALNGDALAALVHPLASNGCAKVDEN